MIKIYFIAPKKEQAPDYTIRALEDMFQLKTKDKSQEQRMAITKGPSNEADTHWMISTRVLTIKEADEIVTAFPLVKYTVNWPVSAKWVRKIELE